MPVARVSRASDRVLLSVNLPPALTGKRYFLGAIYGKSLGTLRPVRSCCRHTARLVTWPSRSETEDSTPAMSRGKAKQVSADECVGWVTGPWVQGQREGDPRTPGSQSTPG